MIVKGELKDVVRTFNNKLVVSFTTDFNESVINNLNAFANDKKTLKIDIDEWKNKRSLNANSYAWVLMDKIASKLNITKEEVYREVIKRVGVFEILPIKESAIESFCRRWKSKGLGWLCDNLGACKTLKGYVHIIAYYGTSTYNTKEMTRFIDDIIEEAKRLDINTITPTERNKLLSLWEMVDNK